MQTPLFQTLLETKGGVDENANDYYEAQKHASQLENECGWDP